MFSNLGITIPSQGLPKEAVFDPTLFLADNTLSLYWMPDVRVNSSQYTPDRQLVTDLRWGSSDAIDTNDAMWDSSQGAIFGGDDRMQILAANAAHLSSVGNAVIEIVGYYPNLGDGFNIAYLLGVQEGIEHAMMQLQASTSSVNFYSKRASDNASLQTAVPSANFPTGVWCHIVHHARAARVIINGIPYGPFLTNPHRVDACGLFVGCGVNISGSPTRYMPNDFRVRMFAIYDGTVTGINSSGSVNAFGLAHYNELKSQGWVA